MENVLYSKKDNIAHIRLNRPEQRNAFNRAIANQLREIWNDFKNDESIWVAILSAEGKSFSAGADVKEMERGQWKLKDSLLLGAASFLPSANNVYKPIICVAQGHVYGAGLVLMLECDIRIITEDAKLGIPEGLVNVPFLFAPFIFDHIPRAIACEMIFTGRPILSEQAKTLGIVNRVATNSELMDTASKMAEMVCRLGPLANFAAKELYCRSRNIDYRSTLTMIEHIATPVWNAEDSKEAKQAFIEKRRPIWKLR